MSSKYANHSRFTSQHDRGDLYDHLMSNRFSTLIPRVESSLDTEMMCVGGYEWKPPYLHEIYIEKQL